VIFWSPNADVNSHDEVPLSSTHFACPEYSHTHEVLFRSEESFTPRVLTYLISEANKMLSWNRATENSVLFVRIPTTSIMVIMYYASHLTSALFTDKCHFISMYRPSISRVSLSIISYLHCMLRANPKAHPSVGKTLAKLKSLLSGLPLVGAWMHDIHTNDTGCERPK